MRKFHINGRKATQTQLSDALTRLREIDQAEGIYAYFSLNAAATRETRRLAEHFGLGDQVSFEAPPVNETGIERIDLAAGGQLVITAGER